MSTLVRTIEASPKHRDAPPVDETDSVPATDATPNDGARRLRQFLVANDYTIREHSTLDPDDRLDSKVLNSVEHPRFVATRGSAGSGWWSSDQSNLRSIVAVQADDNAVHATWVVDTTGQWITDDDEQFWTRETEHAQRAVEGELDHMPDLTQREEQRSKDITRSAVRTGLISAVITFCFILLLGLFGVI